MRFWYWGPLFTYEVLHLTSELTYEVFPAQRLYIYYYDVDDDDDDDDNKR